MPRRIISVLVWYALLAASGGQAAGQSSLTFEADIRPILKAHCFQCHGEVEIKAGGLDLRLRRLAETGGESGPAFVAGQPDASLLLQRVRHGEMPPGDKKLAAHEIERLTQWIAVGAPTARAEPASADDVPQFTDEERNWWAFRPVVRPPVPATQYPGRVATPVDAFILQQLEGLAVPRPAPANEFGFAASADRATLVRRLYLDVLGLPPAPEQVAAFVEDPSPHAWLTLVDRVLASPHYGERWARHWLDVAGYADSEGYTDEDRVREHAYFYRDYVMDAWNSDKPYDQFLTEQLAGDELAGWPGGELTPVSIEKLAATGFLRMAPDGTESGGIDLDVARNQVIADTLQIVGTAVLGLTVHCAQCHDHRYDPIPQRDYYRLRAVFAPALDWTNWRTPTQRQISLYSPADVARRAEIEEQAKKVDAERQERAAYYIARTLEHELLMVDDGLREPLRLAFQTAPAKRTDEQQKLLAAHPNIGNINEGSLYLYDRRREDRARDLDQRREQKTAAILTRVRAEHPSVAATAETLAQFDPAASAELQSYVAAAEEVRRFRIREHLQEFTDKAKAIRDTIPPERFLRCLTENSGNPPTTFVFYRGDHHQPREEVQPGGLSVLDETLAAASGLQTSGRRLQYARHLTNGKHPLVARVLVNRLWRHHFGRGIVATPGDFGALGERPTQPELLDWLAAELVSSGWSIKHLQRLILASAVYQQSAIGTPAVVEADPDNRLYGRWPLRRLESETVRDAMLFAAGQLNTKMHGAPVPVMEDEVGQIVLGKENLDGERKPTDPIPLHGEEFRRSIYVQVRRSRPFGVLESFDLAEMAPCCVERPSSNVAPQALMLMNSEFSLTTSQAFAQRLRRAVPDDTPGQLSLGWSWAFGQRPSPEQLQQCQSFLAAQLTTLSSTQPALDEAARSELALATFCQALFNSNRFLYID